MSQLLDVLLTDTQRLLERRTKPAPPAPVSRADQIISEGDRRRVAYRCAHPNADTAMTFGAQIGYLHGMVRKLVDEADALTIRRDPKLVYDAVSTDDIPEAIVGYTYTPGLADWRQCSITSPTVMPMQSMRSVSGISTRAP